MALRRLAAFFAGPFKAAGAAGLALSAGMLSGCVADRPKAALALAPAPLVVAEAVEPISGSAEIDRLIEKHAVANGIPPALAFGVVRVESRYNPNAKGSGVYGLSQIKPATARSLGFNGPASALFDPETNLTYGMKYLKGAWEKGGQDVCRASMKYKGGHRATNMSKSTLAYCASVKKEMAEVRERRRMPEMLQASAAPALARTDGLTAPAAGAASARSAQAEASPTVAAMTAAGDGATLPGVERAAMPVAATSASPAPAAALDAPQEAPTVASPVEEADPQQTQAQASLVPAAVPLPVGSPRG